MKILTSLTITLTCVFGVAWGYAAPPRVTGNRPVVIEVPVPDSDDDPSDNAASGRGNRDLFALLLGQTDPEPAARPPRGASRTSASEMKRARELLLKHSSITAKVVETVSIFDHSYKAEGKYLQTSLKPNDWHMRLELRLRIGDSDGSLLEVCDGDVLWTSTEIVSAKPRTRSTKKDEKNQTIMRRNVTEIMNAVRKLNDEPEEKKIIASLGLGGLPGLLAAIESNMDLAVTPREETLRDRPVYVIQGTWNENFKKGFQPQSQQGQSAQSPPGLLPAFVPDSARIYLDQETGFPHRIVYRKKLQNREVHKDMLTLDFLDVTLNQPINSSEFAYNPPPGVQPMELTKQFLERIVPSDSRSRSQSGRSR